MKTSLFLAPLLIAVSAQSATTPAARTDFQSVLSRVATENPRVLSSQYEALADKSAQLAQLLSWSPTITAQAAHSIPQWGLDVGDTAELQVKMNVFRFGQDASKVRMASRIREQADLRNELAVLDAEDKAARLLFQWIELQKRQESQRALWTSKRELERVAQDRFRRGQLPSQEADKVRLDLANAEIQIRQSDVDLIDLKVQLESVIEGASNIKEWPWSATLSQDQKKAPKELAQKFSIRNLMLETEVRDSRKFQALTTWLPSLDVSSSWQTTQVQPLGRGEWVSYLTLTVPLWDGGNALSTRNYWDLQQKAAQESLAAAQREEGNRLKTLETRRELLRSNLQKALESNQKSKSLADDSLKRFQLGRTSVNDLLLDQARVFDSESLLQQALRQYHLVLLESCLAADERPSRCY